MGFCTWRSGVVKRVGWKAGRDEGRKEGERSFPMSPTAHHSFLFRRRLNVLPNEGRTVQKLRPERRTAGLLFFPFPIFAELSTYNVIIFP